MRPRPSYPNLWRILVPIVFLSVVSTQFALAGRNANGALIVHTNDAVAYTVSADYCLTSYLPASCEAAITRTDKDENTPAVIWLLAAFPDTSSPAVTTIQFGIEHNLPANEGYFERYGMCGDLEMPDQGWPETGFGNLLSFGSTVHTEHLFPIYWFAAYGFEGAYLGTRTYPSTDEAKFVDNSSPPVEELVSNFGTVRWHSDGDNACPALDAPGDEPLETGGTWLDRRFGKQWALTVGGDRLLLCFRKGVTESTRQALMHREHLTEVHGYNTTLRVGVYQNADGGDIRDAILRLRQYSILTGVAPSFIDQDGHIRYYMPRQVVVRFQPESNEATCLSIINQRGYRILKDYWTPGLYRLIGPQGKDVVSCVREWYEEPTVQLAEPGYVGLISPSYVPADEYYPEQWSLNNTGQLTPYVPGADIHAEGAWDLTRGLSNVLIAVVDTGAELDHEDLQANLLSRSPGEDWDFVDEDENPDDEDGHGTMVTGIAAATADQAPLLSISGVAPACQFMPLRISFEWSYPADFADAINYAASRRPSFYGLVINCSWYTYDIDFPIIHDAVARAHDQGCVVVGAAGTDDIYGVYYPAAYPEAIAVGATNRCDERKSATSCDAEQNWGSNYGPNLTLVAPGELIPTTMMGNFYGQLSGTSASTPHVAGIAGLILSLAPDLPPDTVRDILCRSADDRVGVESEDEIGFDNYMGWGRANAATACATAHDLTAYGWYEVANAAITDQVLSASWGDYDGDHFPDLYVRLPSGEGRLWKNLYYGRFINATPTMLRTVGGSSSMWFDADNDGNMDLYVFGDPATAGTLFYHDGFGFREGDVPALEGPCDEAEPCDFDRDGDMDVYQGSWTTSAGGRLIINDGDMTFSDGTTPPLDLNPVRDATWVDYNNDGLRDLYVAQQSTGRLFYQRQPPGGFNETYGPFPGQRNAWGDYDHDGRLDVYVTNATGGNHLLRNTGNPPPYGFEDVTVSPIDDADPGCSDALWIDYDNDGWIDLYTVHTGTYGNHLYRNIGTGFVDVTSVPLLCNDIAVADASACRVDYDMDGDEDLFVAQAGGGRSRLLQNFAANVSEPNHWVNFRLMGVVSNSYGVGAVVKITTGGVQQMQVVGSSGAMSKCVGLAHFGLGQETEVDEVEIRWPSGGVQTFGPVPAGEWGDPFVTVWEMEEGSAPGNPDNIADVTLSVMSPTEGKLRIWFDLPSACRVDLGVYGLDGRRIKELIAGPTYAGRHEVQLDASGPSFQVARGMYFIRLKAGNAIRVTKLVVLGG